MADLVEVGLAASFSPGVNGPGVLKCNSVFPSTTTLFPPTILPHEKPLVPRIPARGIADHASFRVGDVKSGESRKSSSLLMCKQNPGDRSDPRNNGYNANESKNDFRSRQEFFRRNNKGDADHHERIHHA